jgi:phosphatidylglycerophosphate synthase
MSSRAVVPLVIDARPRGPRGLLAAEIVLGRSVLGRLIDLVTELGVPGRPVVVHAREEEHEPLRALTRGASARGLLLVSGMPRADEAVLRTDCLYDARRLRLSLRRGASPETAVVWRLDGPEALLKADEELTRRLTYQPLGKYWAFPLARRLAEFLRPTAVRPNALTMAAGILMLFAAGIVGTGIGGWAVRFVVAAALAGALVLDTADGRLARLQGTSSALGRWLDQVLDELADLALHGAIAWSAFRRDGYAGWLVLGIVYASAKYLFHIQSYFGNELEHGSGGTGSVSGRALHAPTSHTIGASLSPRVHPRFAPPSQGGASRPGLRARPLVAETHAIANTFRMIGHADVRWHLWIVLAVLGRLDLALCPYAIYFTARAVGGAVRKGARYA